MRCQRSPCTLRCCAAVLSDSLGHCICAQRGAGKLILMARTEAKLQEVATAINAMNKPGQEVRGLAWRVCACVRVRVCAGGRYPILIRYLRAGLTIDRPHHQPPIPPQAIVVPADVSDAAALEPILQATVEQHGDVDLLINNAGAGAWKHVEETAPSEAYQVRDGGALA